MFYSLKGFDIKIKVIECPGVLHFFHRDNKNLCVRRNSS